MNGTYAQYSDPVRHHERAGHGIFVDTENVFKREPYAKIYVSAHRRVHLKKFGKHGMIALHGDPSVSDFSGADDRFSSLSGLAAEYDAAGKSSPNSVDSDSVVSVEDNVTNSARALLRVIRTGECPAIVDQTQTP